MKRFLVCIVVFLYCYSNHLNCAVTKLKAKCGSCVGPRGLQGPAGVDATGNNFLFAYDTTSQVIAMPNVFQVINFNTSPSHIDGWVHESPSVFRCKQTGLYSVDYTITAQTSIFDETVVSAIGSLDDNEIVGSQIATSLTVLNHPISFSKKFLMQCEAEQIFNLAVTASDPGVMLMGGGTGSVKASCSVIISRVR